MFEYKNDLVEKMHKVVFKIMNDIDEFCKKNNITYYLSGGSCLGAVRHQGFIPWDHDADLMMPRNDYEKFLKTFGEAYVGKYKVGSLYTDKEWIRQYSKVWDLRTRLKDKDRNDMERGVSVDIFPIDGMPTSTKAQRFCYKRAKFLFYLHLQFSRVGYTEHEKLKVIKAVLRKCPGKWGARKTSILLDKLAKKYDFDSSRYVAVILACHYWEKETLSRKDAMYAVNIPFEGKMFPVLNGYDQYLRNLYGNYMVCSRDHAEDQEKVMSKWELIIDEDLLLE